MGSLGVSQLHVGRRGLRVACLGVSLHRRPRHRLISVSTDGLYGIIVLISLVPLELSGPLYDFSISQLGLTYIAQLVGNLIGCDSCGYLNDVLSQWSARRNHGVIEPEMRLPVIIIPTILGPAGILMFGIGIVKEAHWIVPIVGDALLGVALASLPSIVQPYLMESYYPVSMDALTVSLFTLPPCIILLSSLLNKDSMA
jgi:hypothetical protein